MTTITAYPCADVSLGLTPEHPANPHWYHLSNTDYLHGTSDAGYTDDWYTFDRPEANGAITKITLRIVACSTPSAGKTAKISFRATHTGTIYTLHEFTLTTSYIEHTFDVATNPATGVAWTWSDFDVAEFALSLNHTTAHCITFNVDIVFSHSPGTLWVGTGTWKTKFYGFDGDTIYFVGDWIRTSHNHGSVVIASPGTVVTGNGSVSGGWGDTPIIYTIGSVQLKGVSLAQPLTIKHNLYHGAQFNYPSNCLIQDVNFEDCRSGTSTVPTIGDSALGLGAWLYGAGSGNTISYCNFKRCGMHAIQLYGNDNNTIDHCTIDGVYGYFGISLYQSDGDTVTSCTTKNTRREGINAMECTNTTLNYPAVYDTQTDYGICIYLSNGTNVILEPTVHRAYKNGISLEGANNTTITDGELVDCGRGAYVGWKSGILLLGSGAYNCSGNVIDGTRIIDKNHYLRNGIMETDASNCLSNTVRDVTVYGVRAAKVRFCATSGSVEE